MRINSAKIISTLMLITLPYGNVTKIFGTQDGFSVITISLIFVFLIINFIQNFRTNFFSNVPGIVFIILIIATLINLKSIGFVSAISNVFKFLVFILLIDFIKKNKFVFNYFLLNYYKVYLFSLVISLPLFLIFPLEEFVFFDGKSRFGGLHFELFNFVFSTILFFVSWMYNKKNIKLGLLISLILIYFAKSNIFYLYLIVSFFVFFLRRLFNSRFFSYATIIVLILSPVAIGFFLELLDFLNLFSVRRVTTFTQEGSSVYTRLYPYSLAVQHLIGSGWNSLLPMGLGYFENTDLVTNDNFSYGGTGSPKALVDFGMITFLLIIFYISKLFFTNIKKLDDLSKKLYVLLFFSSLIFISYGSGFFNIVAWFCILSNPKIWKNKLYKLV